MQRPDARGTAGRAGAIAYELGGVHEQLVVKLIETWRETDAPGVDLVHGHGRKLRGDGPHLSHRAEVTRIAHQPQARDVPKRVAHALQPGLERLATQRPPQSFVDRDPVARRVQRLLRQMDRPRADVLVGVKPDLLEHLREARGLDLAVASRDALP